MNAPAAPEHTRLATEVESVGLLGRVLRARRWYRSDWWFVVIGGAMAVVFVILGVFPEILAPHDPQEEVGERLLAPLESANVDALAVLEGSGIEGVEDLAADDRVPVGIVGGSTSGQVLRDEADRITEELRARGEDTRIRVRFERYETTNDAVEALVAGEVVAVADTSSALSTASSDFPGVQNLGPIAGSGSSAFLLGTTQIGQDVLSRVIWGTRVALLVGFIAPIISLLIGVPLGLISGFTGGAFDRGAGPVMDSLYAFPSLILAIAITAVLGPSLVNVIVALGVVYVPTYFRVARGQTLQTKQLLYVEAARSLGAGRLRIMRDFVAPSVLPSIVVLFSVSVADAILIGAGLSFLGLGLPPEIADWGRDLARGQPLIGEAWWLVVFPGIMIALSVLAFTLLGEGLVEIYNPRLRER